MLFEEIHPRNLKELTRLMIALWPDCEYEEEFRNCQKILTEQDETCFLAKEKESYIGFIQVSIRKDYVDGADPGPKAYIEGIYIDPAYRKSGIAKSLVEMGEAWGKKKGCKQYGSDVELHNLESIAFHKKVGFTEMNRIVCFLKDID